MIFWKKISCATLLILVTTCIYAQSRVEFIRQYKGWAIEEMQRRGIPASITMAQAILESNCGKSALAIKANNFFGIKCHTWNGNTYYMTDDAPDECFRKYRTERDSWTDHSNYLWENTRYKSLFELAPTNYRGWAKGLKACGYATSSSYAERLINIIEAEKLYYLDTETQTSPSDLKMKNPYSNREEIINGVLCIEVESGERLSEIASSYQIKMKRILKYNDKQDERISEGDIIFLKNKRYKAAPGYTFHRVKAGDSIYEISQRYGMKLKSLVYFNNLTPQSRINVGDKLNLRRKLK